MSYNNMTRRIKEIHVLYKMNTGLDAPDFDTGRQADYIEWLENQNESLQSAIADLLKLNMNTLKTILGDGEKITENDTDE